MDGRVLGASQVEYKPFRKLPLKREMPECRDSLQKPCIELPPQVEYKPFGKLPLKRELQHKWHQFNTSATCATCVHIPAAPAWHRSLPGRATCPALKPRQAAEHPLSPGSLLYVLYVLYTLYALQNVVYVLYKAYLVHVEMLCV